MSSIYRSINEPIRQGQTYEDLHRSFDLGLILAWEIGRKKAIQNPELKEKALRDELIPLGWKGGVKPMIDKEGFEVAPMYKFKLGSFKYLAEYMGLRGEDLDLDLEIVYSKTCSRFAITVEFTNDHKLLARDAQVSSSSFF